MAETPVRYFRIAEDLWLRAGARFERENVTPSEMVRSWFEAYANEDQVMSIPEEVEYLIDRLEFLHKRLGFLARQAQGDADGRG